MCQMHLLNIDGCADANIEPVPKKLRDQQAEHGLRKVLQSTGIDRVLNLIYKIRTTRTKEILDRVEGISCTDALQIINVFSVFYRPSSSI